MPHLHFVLNNGYYFIDHLGFGEVVDDGVVFWGFGIEGLYGIGGVVAVAPYFDDTELVDSNHVLGYMEGFLCVC